MESEDEVLELSGSALAALHDFYSEKAEQARRFDELKAQAEERAQMKLNIAVFEEDWNSSQFWYSDETAEFFARKMLDGATNETSIAVVSAPSAFIKIKNLLMSDEYDITPRLYLLEYDDRFSIFSEHVHYDYRAPMSFPDHLKGQIDRMICDPPFFNEDCQTKFAMTIRGLSRPVAKPDADNTPETPRIIVCTGERMESLIHKLYPNMRTTSYEPIHAQERLSNEFRCYANFASSSWTWR